MQNWSFKIAKSALSVFIQHNIPGNIKSGQKHSTTQRMSILAITGGIRKQQLLTSFSDCEEVSKSTKKFVPLAIHSNVSPTGHLLVTS
jgi:hypothetical protein